MVKKSIWGDYVITGAVVMIGLAEAVHFGALFLGWSLSRCSVLFGILLLVALIAVLGAVAVKKYIALAKAKGVEDEKKRQKRKKADLAPVITGVIFGAVVLAQVVFICNGGEIYRDGDMTVETVGSFLVNDGVYKVNPLTGLPYTAGLPLRLEILGLPTLYSMISYLTGLSPVFLVRTIIPIVNLILTYVAFAVLGKVLFPTNRQGSVGFLLAVSLLMWVGAYMYGMDGFSLLCSGWRGVAIRNLILIPWLISLCIRRKWLGVLLCLAAEVCVVWTFYGLGACIVVALGMAIAGSFGKFLDKNENSAGKGKEESA